jgi:hypothetical protein
MELYQGKCGRSIVISARSFRSPIRRTGDTGVINNSTNSWEEGNDWAFDDRKKHLKKRALK